MKTTDQLIDCAQRELSMRRKFYPGWIQGGRMTRDKANHEMECMEQILKVLQLRKDLEEVSEEIKKIEQKRQEDLPFE